MTTPTPGPTPSRRQALGTISAGVGGAIAGAWLMHASAPAARAGVTARPLGGKSGLEPIILGTGDHQYEVQHDWARLPATHAFGNTHGVAVDRQGHVYIKHTVHASSQSSDAMCVFDPAGKFVRSWGAEYKGGAHGLTLSGEGTKGQDEYLYTCDCNRSVVKKATLAGELVHEFAWPEASGVYNNKGEYKPTNLAIVPHHLKSKDGTPHPRAGHVYIADGYGKSWIHEYKPGGEYVRSFAGPGKERGQTACPHGIAIDSRGRNLGAGEEPRLIVADRSNRRLQYFTLDGRHDGFVTSEMRSPCHFDVRGDVLLVPDLEARVTLLDASNNLIAHLGDGESFALRDKPREQFVDGKFIAPHSACFDLDGNILVVEWVEVGRVTRLKKLA